MQKKALGLIAAIFVGGCSQGSVDPWAFAPSSPYASWSPMKGNSLISSKYCQTLLPETFGENALNLGELIDIALQNNPSTKQTWAMARALAAQYGQSLSSFYPDVEFQGSYVRAKGTFIQERSPFDYLTTQAGPDITLSYTLFDFGQRSSSAMAAREALYYADFSHNQALQTVLQTVMDDYYNYLYQLEELKANEANLANAQMSLDSANERFALGLAALGDVAQARTQFLQNRIALTSQKQNVENAFAKMATDVGVPASLRFRVEPMPEKIEATPVLESVDRLIREAQEKRQDFLAAQANLRSKQALLLGSKRAILPVLTTNLDSGHYWFDHGLQEKNFHWSASFFLKFPLFSGFYYKNGVRNAEAEVEKAKAYLLQTELSLVEDVSTSHMGVQTAALNLFDTDEYLKSAELEFTIAIAGYKAGTGTILDVLSAQSSLADARSQKAKAQQNWFTSLASLAYATGSLCSAPCTEGEAP